MEQGAQIALVSECWSSAGERPGLSAGGTVPTPSHSSDSDSRAFALLAALSARVCRTRTSFSRDSCRPVAANDDVRSSGFESRIRTIIFYEAPHRIEERTLVDAPKSLAIRRLACTRSHQNSRRVPAVVRLLNWLLLWRNKPGTRRNYATHRPIPADGKLAHRDTSQSLADRVEELMRQAKLDRKGSVEIGQRRNAASPSARVSGRAILETEDSGESPE